MDIVRVYIGVGIFVKGIYFMSQHDELMKMVEQVGALGFIPSLLAHYIVPAHLFGGTLLALGLFTRIAAAVQVPILFGAVFYVYLPHMATIEGRQSFEFTALVLFLVVLTTIFGPGRFSVDHWLAHRTPYHAHAGAPE